MVSPVGLLSHACTYQHDLLTDEMDGAVHRVAFTGLATYVVGLHADKAVCDPLPVVLPRAFTTLAGTMHLSQWRGAGHVIN